MRRARAPSLRQTWTCARRCLSLSPTSLTGTTPPSPSTWKPDVGWWKPHTPTIPCWWLTPSAAADPFPWRPCASAPTPSPAPSTPVACLILKVMLENIPRHGPLSRVIGSTFEHSFALPKPANAGNPKGRKRNSGRQKAPLAQAAKNDSSRLHNTETPGTRQGRERVLKAENRRRRKALGLCKDCRNKAIPGQSRCPDCVEKNRQRRRSGKDKPGGGSPAKC